MRNLLALVGLALVLFGGLGWYLGWYKIKAAPADSAGHRKIELDVDTKKFGNDVQNGLHSGEEHLQKWLDNGKNGTTDPTKTSKEQPGKTGAVRAVPDVTGFPFDPPGTRGPATKLTPPALSPTLDDAPVPGTFFKKTEGPASEETFGTHVGYFR